VEQKLPTLSEHRSSHPVSSEVHVARFLDFCVVFCGSLFLRFFWSLYYLSFFDLRILIISPLRIKGEVFCNKKFNINQNLTTNTTTLIIKKSELIYGEWTCNHGTRIGSDSVNLIQKSVYPTNNLYGFPHVFIFQANTVLA
jgi:hypothetical protein